jgi:hypothetical protein
MCVSQAHELGRHRGCTSESGVLMNTEALSFIDHVATNSTIVAESSITENRRE